jgi:hypothetical protein
MSWQLCRRFCADSRLSSGFGAFLPHHFICARLRDRRAIMNLTLVRSAKQPLELCDMVASALRRCATRANEKKVRVEVLVSERILGFKKKSDELAETYRTVFHELIEKSAPGSTLILTHTLNRQYGATLGFAATSIDADSPETKSLVSKVGKLAENFNGRVECEKLKFEGMRLSIIYPADGTIVVS